MKLINIGFTGQLAENVHLAFLLIEDLRDLIMGMDVPDQTAPENHLPDIKSVFAVGVETLTLINESFPVVGLCCCRKAKRSTKQ